MEKAKLLTEKHGITSLQYALIDGGEIVVSGQTGKNDNNNKVPLTPDTIYGIGSTSKMFLTASVMKLVEEGKVDLDLPVVNYIPDFQMKDHRYKRNVAQQISSVKFMKRYSVYILIVISSWVIPFRGSIAWIT